MTFTVLESPATFTLNWDMARLNYGDVTNSLILFLTSATSSPFGNSNTTTSGSAAGTLAPGDYTLYAVHTASAVSGYYSKGLNFGFQGDASGINGIADFTLTLTSVPVPLPAAAWLLVSGLGGIAAFVRRRALSAARQLLG